METEIKVSQKLAEAIRERHVEAQKRIAEYANEKEEQGNSFSICSGLDVSATAFLLYNVMYHEMTVKDAIEDCMGFMIEHVIRQFVGMDGIRERINVEMDEDATLDELMHAVGDILQASGHGFVASGDSIQDIADQVQGMADAEKATKQ